MAPASRGRVVVRRQKKSMSQPVDAGMSVGHSLATTKDHTAAGRTIAAPVNGSKPDGLSDKSLKTVFGRNPPAEVVKAATFLRNAYSARGFALLSTAVPTAPNADVAHAWDPYEAGRRAVDAMKWVGGEPLSREDAAARLSISLASLYNRIKEREVVVWTDPAGRFRFPAWQFGVNGLMPGVVDCLKLLGTDDHWAVMRFFLTPSEMAGDVAPIELLRTNRIDEAKAVASAAGAHA